MYCSKCGTLRVDEAKFCAGCGTQFDEVMNDRPEPEQEIAEVIQEVETPENSDASSSESESLSAEDDVADEETMEDVESDDQEVPAPAEDDVADEETMEDVGPDDQEVPAPAEDDVADEETMEDVGPDDQEVPAQAEAGDSVKMGTDGSDWIEESNSTSQNKGISKPVLIGVSAVIVAAILIIVISIPGDQGGGISKDELVEQLRNGDRSGTDFTGVDLSDSDLSGLDNMELFGLDFSGADLSLVDFTGSDLGYVDFTDAILSNAIFSNNNLEGATFSGYYSSVTIRDSNLKSTLWDGELDWVRFENVDLSWAEFGGSLSQYAITLDSVWFTDSTFYGTQFHCFENEGDVRFYRNSISYMSLTDYYFDCGTPDWSDAYFGQNIFSDVYLEGGNFESARFLCNSFIGSYLSYNDFTYTHFQTVYSTYTPDGRYQGTEVCDQTFTDTQMEDSTFGTFLEGTSFVGSSLEYSSMSVSEDVTWWDTICPDGTNSDDNENTCENNL